MTSAQTSPPAPAAPDAPPTAVPARALNGKVVAYVPNWIDLKTFSDSIDYARITHINIAFENPINEKGDLSFSKQNEFLIAKAHANHVQVLISIGGGSASGDKALRNRYFDLLSDAKRAGFVANLAAYVEKHQFDGLDVDIEGPSINKDYGAFVQDLSNALKPQGKLLTAALSQGYGGSNVPDTVFPYFDFVNIMAYDGAGYWEPKAPGQHSSLEFAKSNVAYWLKRGLPKSKAVLGVPFYGYGFGEAFRQRDYSYSAIVAAYPGAENTDQVGNTIWFNGIPTIKAKTDYVVEQGLAGIMIWSLDYDVKGERSLLTAIYGALSRETAAPPVSPAAIPILIADENPANVNQPLKMAFVGASITAGVGTAKPERDSYPAQLARMLGDKWRIRNFGVSATTLIHSGDVPYIRTGAYKQALAFAPDVLVIDLGGNDSKPQNFEAHPQDFVPDYQAMVEAFRKMNANVRVYAAQPVPAFPENYGIRDSVISEKIMPAILQAAEAAHISVIDLHTPLLNRAADFADKVHPNEAGARTMAETIYGVLKRDFPTLPAVEPK